MATLRPSAIVGKATRSPTEDLHLQILKEEEKDTSPEARKARQRMLLRAVVGELLGTLLFFFSICGFSISLNRANPSNALNNVGGCLASAFVAIALIYSFADLSGAHFNPAVTLATWLTGKTSNRKSLLYFLSQIIGSIVSMALLCLAFPDWKDNMTFLSITPGSNQIGRVFFLEFMLTFILVFVIFTVAFENVDPRRNLTKVKGFKNAQGLTLYHASPQSKTGFAPLAIGFTIGFLSLIGGAFNPARVFGPAIYSGVWTDQWVYWIADACGAAAAAAVRSGFMKWGVPETGNPARPFAKKKTPSLNTRSALEAMKQQQQQNMPAPVELSEPDNQPASPSGKLELVVTAP